MTNQFLRYKKIFRKNGISNRIVSIYIGTTREFVALLLNGKTSTPDLKQRHIIREFEALIETRKGFKTKKIFNSFIEQL